MITTLLAHRSGLARGALAFLLSQQADIEVIAEIGHGQDVESGVLAHRPKVALVDLDLTTPDGMPVARTLCRRHQHIRMLVLAEPHRLAMLEHALAAGGPGVAMLSKDRPPDNLVAAVRAVANDQPVRDVPPRRAAARFDSPLIPQPGLRPGWPPAGPGASPPGPLTPREWEVLWLAANGASVREIAATLSLSCGTVQNHLGRIINKTGSRSRVQAVHAARRAGWI